MIVANDSFHSFQNKQTKRLTPINHLSSNQIKYQIITIIKQGSPNRSSSPFRIRNGSNTIVPTDNNNDHKMDDSPKKSPSPHKGLLRQSFQATMTNLSQLSHLADPTPPINGQMKAKSRLNTTKVT